jgi:hypothetical protein
MPVLRANVDFAKRILADRVGNAYVYGGNWNPFNLKVGTDCSGLVVDILDATVNGTAMAWTRHGMSTESWRPVEVGQRGPFGTICVAHPRDFPADAAVKIAIHHGPGGGANSHTWCEVDGVRGESNGTNGCVTGSRARDVNDTSYANDWHYLPGPIVAAGAPPPPPPASSADGYALLIISEGRRRGITARGIQIALSTGLVESGLKVYANTKVPASMPIPHDAVGSDGFSVGIFQQQVIMGENGWWWGDAPTCMDPTRSAGLFYDRLARMDYNSSGHTPGWYAWNIQQPAEEYRGRYDERFNDAVALYNRLANTTPPPPQGEDDLSAEAERKIAELYAAYMGDVSSLSPLRHLGEGNIGPIHRIIRNIDGSVHVTVTKLLAALGHPDSLALLKEVAGADLVRFPDRAKDKDMAVNILADITAKPQAVIAQSAQELQLPAAPQVVYLPAPAAPAAPATLTSSVGQKLGAAFDALSDLKLDENLPPAAKAPLDALLSVLQNRSAS